MENPTIRQIIDKLNLYPEKRKRLTQDDLVELLRKDIEIELVRDNRNELTSFNIYFSSKTPSVAQRVTSELSNLFISENLEARQQQSQNTTEFLASRLEEARKTLSQQEEKVREFKDKHLGELPGQLQSNLQILTGLQAQMQAEEDNLNLLSRGDLTKAVADIAGWKFEIVSPRLLGWPSNLLLFAHRDG